MQSRLSRNLEKKNKQRLILTVAGIIVILVVIVTFGVPFLINFSLFLSHFGEPTVTSVQKQKDFITPPILSIPFSATNSAAIDVSGTAVPNEEIKLYVNDNLVNTVSTKDDGSFTFSNVSLEKGTNSFSAKAKKNDSESTLSDAISVAYSNTAPNLTVENPADGASFPHDQASVTVSGKTDPDIKVTVNDFWAIVDGKGNYSYTLNLQNGDNPIKIVASDLAGNKTEKDIKVTRSQ